MRSTGPGHARNTGRGGAGIQGPRGARNPRRAPTAGASGGPTPAIGARPQRLPLLDARILVWLLVIVFVTGLPLMLFFDADAGDHAQRLQGWAWLRHLHAGASLALLAGAVWHLVARLGGTYKGVRTGAWLLAAVGLATFSGALAAQTDHARTIAAAWGLRGDATVLAAVGHIAYATILVLLTLYLHVARWGWRSVLSDWRHALLAWAPAALLAWLLPVGLPGGAGGGATAWIAPPWPVLAAWPVLLGLGVWGAKALRAKQP